MLRKSVSGSDEYLMIAEELPELTIADLDPRAVELARAYAKRSHRRWPPKPITTGWTVTIHSIR